MLPRPRIGQLIEANDSGWQGPVPSRQFNSPWAQEHGYAAEDWNFAVQDVVDEYLYGFGQGYPGVSRTTAHGHRYDVFFFLRDSDGLFRGCGFYLDAELLDEAAAEDAWLRLANEGVIERRVAQLSSLGLAHSRSEVDWYSSKPAVTWRVKIDHVRFLDDLPIIEPLRRTDWRFSDAYDYGKWQDWENLLARSRALTEPKPGRPDRVRLSRIKLKRYRAFPEATLEIAPLTLLIGRNNAGKSALCRAPWLFTRCWLHDARLPFQLKTDELDLGGTLAEVIYKQSMLGMTADIQVSGCPTTVGPTVLATHIGATYVPERGNRQQITDLELVGAQASVLARLEMPTWESARDTLKQFPVLHQLATEMELVIGLRPLPSRSARWDGFPADSIGATGQGAYSIWAAAEERGDRDALERFSDAFNRILLARPELEIRGGTFDAFVTHGFTRVRSHLLDAGAGIGQVLPFVAALTLIPPEKQPSLYCIEQPELHLHPRAHGELAEFFARQAITPNGPRFLIETHSDALVLRIRALLAERILKPSHVRLYYIDDEQEGGSQARLVPLNDRGTPEWWPEGIFAEPQEEFLRIRRALARRDGES